MNPKYILISHLMVEPVWFRSNHQACHWGPKSPVMISRIVSKTMIRMLKGIWKIDLEKKDVWKI